MTIANAQKKRTRQRSPKGLEAGSFFGNAGGLAAFRKFSLPSADTSKALYLQCIENFQVPFSASRCGKGFSPHFLQTENGPVCMQRTGRRGFNSLCHIKRGVVITQI